VLHRSPLVRRFVDDLFVPDFPDFENFMYLEQDPLVVHIPKNIFLLELYFYRLLL
jgi:hypothetical protein